MFVPNTQRPQKIPIRQPLADQMLCAPPPFDILKVIAAVNFEWVEVVREGDAH
jgi:hypothetical protein